ncbi:MAG: TIGR03936 family radical SAM-associated protein [Lachnospirales bacterium]
MLNSGEVVNTNIKYRLEFSKTDRMVFIGHLDLLKFFQRTFKRAGIPIGHSWGFNPHQLTTFAVPLALGVSSVGEILDIQLTEKMDCEEIKNTLNNNLPEGVDILQVVELQFSAENCAAAVDYADYCVTLDGKYDNINEVVNEILSTEEINIERTVKKKTKIVNIRPFIKSIVVDNEGDKTEIYANIATGSQGNLKIDVLLDYIYKKMGVEFRFEKVDILRSTLYTDHKGELLPLCLEEEFM